MDDFDAYEDDMGWSRMSDEQIERILRGDSEGLLGGFADDVRATFAAAPDEPSRARHLAALAESARLLAPRAERSAERVAAARPTPLRRWKLVLSQALATATAKIVLTGVALAGTTGGLAATGNLPDAAQNALAKAAAKAGFELPAGADETDPGQTDTGTVPGQTDTATLPDQASDTAKRVHAVKDAWEGEKGCEFGHAVSAAARDTEPKECKNSDEAESEEKMTGKPEGAPGGNANGQSEEKTTGKPEGAPGGNANGQSEEKTTGKPEGAPGGNANGQSEEKTTGTPEGAPGGNASGQSEETLKPQT